MTSSKETWTTHSLVRMELNSVIKVGFLAFGFFWEFPFSDLLSLYSSLCLVARLYGTYSNPICGTIILTYFFSSLDPDGFRALLNYLWKVCICSIFIGRYQVLTQFPSPKALQTSHLVRQCFHAV